VFHNQQPSGKDVFLNFVQIKMAYVFTFDQVWGSQVYVEERTVDVHIRRLRKQLQPFDMDSLLQTVHGSGYRFSRH